jgi:hypothetical protein
MVERETIKLNLRSKLQVFKTGRVAGGKPFSRGQIYHILRNPIYLGLIRHKDKTWPGQHKDIIGEELWDRVQDKLIAASRRKRGGTQSKDGSGQTKEQPLLTGKLFDETGDRLTPTSTTRRGRKLRYYVSNRLIAGGTDPSGWRLSAPSLEKQIATILADHIEVQAKSYALTKSPDLHQAKPSQRCAITIITSLRSNGLGQYKDLIDSLRLHPKILRVKLDTKGLAKALGIKAEELSEELIEFELPWQKKRRGVENKLVIGDPEPEPDLILIRMLAKAHQWAQEMKVGIPLKQIALSLGVTPSYIRTRSKLSFLSPQIQMAIVKGTLSPEFTTNQILSMKIPRDWALQNTLFGV